MTFEFRAKRIVQRLEASFTRYDVDWVCNEFWRESDIAMRKHILLTLHRAMPDKDIYEMIVMLCRFSEGSKRDRETVREVYEWSLRH